MLGAGGEDRIAIPNRHTPSAGRTAVQELQAEDGVGLRGLRYDWEDAVSASSCSNLVLVYAVRSQETEKSMTFCLWTVALDVGEDQTIS